MKKLFLVNNNLKDDSIADLLRAISLSNGIIAFALIQNQFSNKSYHYIASDFLSSYGVKKLRRFVLKNPNPKSVPIKELRLMTSSFEYNGVNLGQLNKLSLSSLGLDSECLENVSKAVANLGNL